ncbi:MAG TPA: sterol desaturase family protein [Cytophagales bacterium]|nr:sterol desaturase family protein [Cytophagales bacterium]
MQFITEEQFVKFSIPYYIVIILAEIVLSNYHKQELYTLKDTMQNLSLMVVNMLIDLSFRILYIPVLMFLYEHRWFQIDHVWIYWIGLLLAEDFLYYWLHRTDHACRLFWACHATHHSSSKYNLTVGFRSTVFEPIYRFVFFAPLPLMGFEVADILLMYAMTQIWGILVHTQRINKLGVLEHILVTPSHHRVHHASNIKYLDRNMGMFLIVWDKLFGTFQKELTAGQYQPIKYGLTTEIDARNPLNLVFHEWSAIWKDVSQKGLTLSQRCKYIFGPPGWSHDGSRRTSEELRALEECGAPPSVPSKAVLEDLW